MNEGEASKSSGSDSEPELIDNVLEVNSGPEIIDSESEGAKSEEPSPAKVPAPAPAPAKRKLGPKPAASKRKISSPDSDSPVKKKVSSLMTSFFSSI